MSAAAQPEERWTPDSARDARVTVGQLEQTLARLTYYYRKGGGGTVCKADAHQLSDVFGAALECFQMACGLPQQDPHDLIPDLPPLRKVSPDES